MEYKFYTIEEVNVAINKLNTYWGFDPNDPMRDTYFTIDSFFYNGDYNYWFIEKNEWTICLE